MKPNSSFRSVIFLSCLLWVAQGCSTLPERPQDTLASSRMEAHALNVAGYMEPKNPAHSGVTLLNDPREALLARLALADAAQASIDVQYYIWAADAVGAAIVARLLKAADRGVRVRLLVDDLSLIGSDQRVLALHSHPNIEVRAYNPFRFRKRYRVIRRTLDIVRSAARINHRMHNKTFVIDNSAAIVGGRNLADAYFGADAEQSYRDTDILTAGPVVDDISASFDAYWNSVWAIPVHAFVRSKKQDRSLAEMRLDLEANSRDLVRRLNASSIESPLQTYISRMTQCFVEFVADPPSKSDGQADFISPVTARLGELFNLSQREVLIENAYLIPGRRGVEALSRKIAQGVRVQILTNSLVSNDSGASHAGYKDYRKPMLQAGVELFELRPDASLRNEFTLSDVSTASLHTKAAVIDRDTAVVGSFNLDPRSSRINTETSVIVHDEHFANTLADALLEAVKVENSWQLELDSHNRLQWLEPGGARPEPTASLKKRFTARVLSWLPIEWLL